MWQRDQRRCTFVAHDGKRCTETRRLELHHDELFSRGGPATADNLRLLCKWHNLHLARLELGDRFMDQFTSAPEVV